MTINSLLLVAPAETARASRGPAALAIALARMHGAHMTAFAVALDVTSPAVGGDASALAASIRWAAEQADVSCQTIIDHSHAIGVHEAIAEHARVHDLVVTGCARGTLLSERLIAEYLLFEAGRPILVVPADHGGHFASEKVAMAWDGTRAAARALGDAITLLAPKELLLITIDGDKQLPGELDEAGLLAAARRRGTEPSLHRASLGARSIGTALQDEALAQGADLLVMGGYGHSRLRRFLLGSATSGLLEGPRLPTLLSH